MPGMRLTLSQVQRLCGVERAMCAWALDSLVATGFLRVNADATYGRSTEGDVPQLRVPGNDPVGDRHRSGLANHRRQQRL